MYQPVCLSLPTLRLGSPGQGWEDMWGLWPITDQFGSVLCGECAVIFLLSEMGQHGGLSLEAGKRRCVRGGRVGRGSGKPPYWPVQPPCRPVVTYVTLPYSQVDMS